MLSIKKINFSAEELSNIKADLDGYIWIALDVKKGVIAAGDEFAGTLKHALLKQKCLIGNIFGVGLDLVTGDIDYVSPINVKWADKTSTREVPEDKKERAETLIRYFFSELAAFKAEKSKPRFSKRP